MRCQSVGNPFPAEYWCIGGTTIRLRNSTPRIESGVNNSNPDMAHSLFRYLVYDGRYRARAPRQRSKSGTTKTARAASHAILGWREASGSDTRNANDSLQHFFGRTTGTSRPRPGQRETP